MALDESFDDAEPLEVTPEFERGVAFVYARASRNKGVIPPGWRFEWSDEPAEILPDIGGECVEGEFPVLTFDLDQEMFVEPPSEHAPEEMLTVRGLTEFMIIGRDARARTMHLLMRPNEPAISIRMKMEMVWGDIQEILQFMAHTRISTTPTGRRRRRRSEG